MDTTGDIPATVTLTSDVKPQWLNVIRRLQSACHGNQGLAVLSIRVLVDASGEPVLWTQPTWTQPTRINLEPKSRALDTLLILADQT